MTEGRPAPVRRAGLAAALAGSAALAAILILPDAGQGPLAFGLHYSLARLDQSLPLLGLGLALALAPAGRRIAGILLFLAGVALGGLVSEWLAAVSSAEPRLLGYVFLISPACCAIVGLGLVPPPRVAAWLAPPVALIVGTELGLVLSYRGSTVSQYWFAAGAILAGAWLVAVPLLVLRPLHRPGLFTAGRIYGSWLIAIGTLLFAVQLIPPRPAPPIEESAPGAPSAVK